MKFKTQFTPNKVINMDTLRSMISNGLKNSLVAGTDGELLFLVQYCFTRLVQRIFNHDKIQHNILTSDNVQYIRIAFLCHHIHELQTLENGPGLWPTRYMRSCLLQTTTNNALIQYSLIITSHLCLYWSVKLIVYTALHVMQTGYSDENSVCPSVRLSVCPFVCLSVTRVIPDKTEERSVQICIPHERTFIVVFWEEEWLVGGDPFYLKFWVNRPPLERNCRFSTNNRS